MEVPFVSVSILPLKWLYHLCRWSASMLPLGRLIIAAACLISFVQVSQSCSYKNTY